MQRTTHRSIPLGRNRRLTAIASLALVAMVVVGCGGSSSPAASDATTSATTTTAAAGSGDSVLGPIAKATGAPIKVGVISDGKSATNDTSVEGRVATATAKWLNEHKDGIAGHVVEVFECDTAGDPAKGTDCGNQMVEQKVAAVVISQSAVLAQVWPPLHDAHLPVMIYSGNGADLLADTESTFVLADPVASAVQLPLAIAKQAKSKKVAAVVIDVPQATDLFDTTAPPLFKAAGIELNVVPVPLGTADLTPQLQALATDGTGVAFVVGNDALCIAAFNGLRSVGFTGKIGAVAQCITDTTRKAVPGDQLKGMVISAQAPIGTDDPSMALYNAVATTYGKDVALDNAQGAGMFTVLSALAESLEKATGDLTSETITAAIKAAPEQTLLAAGGLTFQCNAKADPANPAVCAAGVLTATLDDKGNPVAYKASNPSTGN